MPQPYYSLASLEPNNSVGFLLKRCGVLMSQVAEARFESLSISFTQWMVLMWLTKQACSVSATQLSAELGHDMGALTRVADELERRGLLRRERSKSDRRAVEIVITAAGRRTALKSKRVLVELLNRLVEPFSPAETDTIIELLQRLYAHLQRAAAELDSPGKGKRPGARRARRRTTAEVLP
jgi:DNA-binding MarR family transcriptional regulator